MKIFLKCNQTLGLRYDDSDVSNDLDDTVSSCDCRSIKEVQALGNDFFELFEKQLFTDVTFKLADGELKGHKAILSSKIT
jgi:hypothetical protein